LGVTVVTLTWSVLAILGVSAVFNSYPYLRHALQVAGGIYLCYVSVRLWRAGASRALPLRKLISPLAAFRLGFFTNIMNPKSALFFGSVFATALPTDPGSATLAAAGGLVVANTLSWHLFLALAFSHPWVQVAYACGGTVLNRFASALVGVFGLHLLAVTAVEVRSR